MLRIAHRGYNAKDNTKLAFENALNHFDMIETDIHKTADNELILYHDDFIGGMFVEKINLYQIKIVDPDIMTLDEFFELFPPRRIKIYLDLKGSTDVAYLLIKYLQEKVVPLENLIIASFNKKHLHIFKFSGLNVKLGFITYNTFQSVEFGMLMNSIQYLIVHSSNLNNELINTVSPYNPDILVCTCDSEYMYKYMCQFPIKGIISDIII
tara:strand:- start:294 stop:923 length:630 start_codon:yes stop_codon:yes gene_type:complete